MFIHQKVYSRALLHKQYEGQQYGGISTPKKHPVIFLFTGKQGKKYGYEDNWTIDGVFHMTGEGQFGDMKMTKGNLAIRDHEKNNKDIHLFEYARSGYVRYLGQMILVGIHNKVTKDFDDKKRNAIVFELAPIEKFTEEESEFQDQIEAHLNNDSIEELYRKAAEGVAPKGSFKANSNTNDRLYRSAAVKLYALKKANGICGACKLPGPFLTSKGQPFLEVHHTTRLSDGGPDHPDHVIAICPNCHRRAHYGNDKTEFNTGLINSL